MDQTTTYFADVDWKKDESVKAFVCQLIDGRDEFNAERKRQAEINIAWYRGCQEVRWSKSQGRMIRLPNPNHRVRVIINMIQPFCDGYHAKLSQEEIAWETMPATGDASDFDTAKLSTQILKSYNESLDTESRSNETDYWAILAGEAFAKVCWDPEGGDPLDIKAEEVGMEPEEFQKEFGADLEKLKSGDVALEVLPIFNVVWGPDCTKFEEAEYVLELHEKSVAYCMEQYGISREDAKTAYPDGKLYRPGGSTTFGDEAHDDNEDLCLVATLWVKKNSAIKGLERGRCAVVIGDKVIKNDSNPYNHGQIPIVSWPFKRPPNHVFGETFVDQLIPPQADLNVNVSQQCENRELMGNPVWLAMQGSISNINDWVSRPGGIREYKGTEPKLQAGASMPASALVQIDKTIRFMQDIVGLHDVSQAKVPSGGRSGRAIALLKDADNERFGPIARARQKFWSKIGHLVLQTVAQFASEERIIRVLGDENSWDTVVFTGKDVVGQVGPRVSYFDVRVKSNGQPGSQAIRQEAILALVERGFFLPDKQEDKTKVLEVLQLGSSREPMDSTAPDRERQRRENTMMARGQYMKPSQYEDHKMHIFEMNLYRKRPDFAKLPPQIQAMFDQHEAEHVGMDALRQFRLQAMVQAALQGAGVIPPPPPMMGGGMGGPPPMAALPPGPPSPQENQAAPLDTNSAPQLQETA